MAKPPLPRSPHAHPRPPPSRPTRFLSPIAVRTGSPTLAAPRPARLGHLALSPPDPSRSPLLQVPPASRGEPRRGAVSPACRFPLLREGNQKGSVPPACRGNLKEGVRNFAYFRTPRTPLTNTPEMGYNRGNEFRPHPPSSKRKRDREGEDAASRNQAQGGENTKSVRRRRIPLTPTLSPLPQGGRGKKGVGGSIQKQVVTHDGEGTMRH
jgi:hypothetical protein